MAIIVQNRFPIDSIDRKAIGVNIPFNAPAVFQSNYLTKDAVRNNLINFFSTDQGERVFNPFFGSGLRKYVFENIDSLTNDFIKKLVTDETSKYFPFVSIAQITTNINEDTNTIKINVKYQVINNGVQDEINIIL
jgi:phage baseplate assembly protein W